MSFVLDSSVTIAWFLPDEYSAPALRLLERAGEDGAVVPDFWRLEVGNAMLVATRRSRMTIHQHIDALVQLAFLPIEVDFETSSNAWDQTLQIAERFRLTLYDACYLELAQRRNLPLASLDRQLSDAAKAMSVNVV